MEELRQRDANLTALKAIGPRKKPKLESDAAGTTTVSWFTCNQLQLPIALPRRSIDQYSFFHLDSQTGGTSVGQPGASATPLRPRIKRVNLRDMVFFMEQERDTCRSAMLYKSYLKWLIMLMYLIWLDTIYPPSRNCIISFARMC